jgi:hypothetical protein
MILDNYLRSGFTFDENEDYLEFQFRMLNSLMLISAFVIVVITILNMFGLHDISDKQKYVEYTYGAGLFAFVYLLRISKSYFSVVAYSILLATLALLSYTLAFMYQNESRAIWFSLLVFAAFIITDCRGGMFFTVISIVIIVSFYTTLDLHLSQTAINSSILGLVVGGFMFLVHSRQVANLKREKSSLGELASTDYLTGVMNNLLQFA